MTRGFRPEIQALRALAVLLVVGFHLWPERLSGGYIGVDVFFVISGYLITDHLVHGLEREGRIDVIRFWGRRMRRLLPAALLVLLVTLAAVLLLAPSTRAAQFATEIGAAAVYALNWVLAANAVDYFAESNLVSPVQHYWSLSVEEQFYFIWPLLLVLAAILARRAGRRLRPVLVALLAVLGAASFAVSIVMTAADQQFAYFATPTHVWEFALGGLLALAGARVTAVAARMPGLAAAASWAGLLAILVSALVFDGATAFPGWIAVLPIGAAVLVIAAGMPGTRLSPAPLLRLRPVQWVGDVSYSLYLWHWPPIVLLPFALGRDLGTLDKLLILAAVLVLAGATKRIVEDPLRGLPLLARGRLRSLVAGAAASALVLGIAAVPVAMASAATANALAYSEDRVAAMRAGDAPCFGAAAALEGADCPDSHLVDPQLGPSAAVDDSQTAWLEWKAERDPFFRLDCEMATPDIEECRGGSAQPSATIALVGDSHVNHLLRPVMELAKAHDWQVLEYMKGSCRPTAPDYASNVPKEQRPDCTRWKSEIGEFVADRPDIDLVVTSGAVQGYAVRPDGPSGEAVADAFGALWTQWRSAGIPVLAVSDVPRPRGRDIPDCIVESGVDEDPCAMPRDEIVAEDGIMIAASRADDRGIGSIELYDRFCDAETCHFVVGGVITHKDNNHMTSTFAATLAPELDERIRALLDAG
ncbi:acyltransferase family protein [Homoserinibacter sp. YIM 151385]|uniref:acyltransferase family protein n=1 Tax=Homoserinibacter sp. YIM 151385 TaxID=2985506 RepID=UPI0022F05E60|nr:acyltransferase family protein [Homoserinibacter sp. YIM 151385]WBU37761.1 acyltransferase family protein [Homoserinibacter sp. YIM 151385]